jgi:hypothetical protein
MAEGVIQSEGFLFTEDGAQFSAKQGLVFWQHGVSQTIPNAVWTPIAFNSLSSTVGAGWTTYVPAATTIAAGSDTAVLPQATINVASTTGFATAGYLVIRISSTDRVIAYTGKNATQFTGCTLGVGTMATGQVIAQANVEFNMPSRTVGPAVAELAWASSAVGLRGTRFRGLNALGAGFHLNAGTTVVPAGVASADPLVRSVATEQPAYAAVVSPSTGSLRVEGFQSSGGILDCPVDQLAAPRLVIQSLSAI